MIIFFESFGYQILISLFLFVLLIWASQLHGRRHPDSMFWNRKLLHMSSVSICGYLILTIDDSLILGTLFLLFSLILWIETFKGLLKVNVGKSLGVPLFPFAFGILLIWGVDRPVIAISAFVLAFADALAGIVGYKFGQIYFAPFFETKTLEGSITFFIVSTVVLWLQPFFSFSISAILVLSLLSTLSEMFSWRGSDNFSIVIVLSLAISYLNIS